MVQCMWPAVEAAPEVLVYSSHRTTGNHNSSWDDKQTHVPGIRSETALFLSIRFPFNVQPLGGGILVKWSRVWRVTLLFSSGQETWWSSIWYGRPIKSPEKIKTSVCGLDNSLKALPLSTLKNNRSRLLFFSVTPFLFSYSPFIIFLPPHHACNAHIFFINVHLWFNRDYYG